MRLFLVKMVIDERDFAQHKGAFKNALNMYAAQDYNIHTAVQHRYKKEFTNCINSQQ